MSDFRSKLSSKLFVLVTFLLTFVVAVSAMKTSSVAKTFWEQLGKPRYISAPMVAQSSLPWRVLVRRHGADLAFTQMMHAAHFKTVPSYRKDYIDWEQYTTSTGNGALQEEARRLDRPMIVQLAGDDPETLVGAGKHVEKYASAIDLNLGCPQNIAKRGHYGAYLLPERDLVLRCLSAMVDQLDCPITAKIRKLPNEEDTISLCQAIEACGVQMITIHGRLVTESKQFTGAPDWDIIKKVKSSVSIPVVANGGIGSKADADRCLAYTGVDAVMASEGLLENPKMFSEEGDRLFREDYVKAQLATSRELLDLIDAFPQPRLLTEARGHLFKMLFRFLDAPAHFDLREALAKGTLEDMSNIVLELERRLSVVDFDTNLAIEKGLVGSTNWYMRHRNEKAALRVMSPKRKLEDEKVEIDLDTKLRLLKERLLERKKMVPK